MAMVMTQILKSYLILCEGKDTVNFLVSYLESEALRDDPRFGEEIQALNFGGVEQFGSFISALPNMDGFEQVRSLLVLRDAEKDVAAAERSVKKAFEESGLPAPQSCGRWNHSGQLSTAYVLMPSCDSKPTTGALEDLCWQILAGDDSGEIRNEVLAFIDRVDGLQPRRLVSHKHKGRLHAFFSTSDACVSLKVGEAARAGAFNWRSEQLMPLRTVIEGGFADLNGQEADC